MTCQPGPTAVVERLGLTPTWPQLRAARALNCAAVSWSDDAFALSGVGCGAGGALGKAFVRFLSRRVLY